MLGALLVLLLVWAMLGFAVVLIIDNSDIYTQKLAFAVFTVATALTFLVVGRNW